MKYRVLKEGVSQRQNDEKRTFVEKAVGEVIEVSDEAAPYLVENGFVEPVSRKRRREESD